MQQREIRSGIGNDGSAAQDEVACCGELELLPGFPPISATKLPFQAISHVQLDYTAAGFRNH